MIDFNNYKINENANKINFNQQGFDSTNTFSEPTSTVAMSDSATKSINDYNAAAAIANFKEIMSE